MAATLAACGGGGSAGTAAPEAAAKPVAVGLSGVKLPTVSGERMIGNQFGAALPQADIEADVTGDLATLSGKQVYVVVNDPNGIFNNAVLIPDSSTHYRLRLFYESATYGATDYDMPVGDFKSSVQVSVCLDAKCNQPFAGTPILMPYSYKVEPGLRVQGFGPGLAPYALSGTPATAVVKDLPVTLPPRTTHWHIEDNGGNGGVKFTAVGPSTLRIEGQAVAAGSYYGNFILRATGTTSSGAAAEFLTSGAVAYEVK
ncbi:MAG: hypothetical protein QM788_03790 [Roseateles sp.]|uniref:hypothetical protein n=1 Tax=Roseateles sp. TaxID=1971397 RepID=UPI0039ED7194